MDEMVLFQENKVEVRRRLKDGRIDYLRAVAQIIVAYILL